MMGNEMGNQNTNALKVSEQESDENTKAISQSPTSSFLPSDLGGLKNLTDYLNDSSPTLDKPETNAELSPVDTSESTSSSKNDDIEKQDGDKLAIDESWDSLTMWNEEHDHAQDGSSETNDSLVKKQELERRVSEDENSQATKTIDEPPKVSDGLKDSADDLPCDSWASEEHKTENLDLNEFLIWEYKHDEQARAAHNESLETDGSLIQTQMPQQGEEDANFLAQELTNKGGQLEKSILERQNECVTANSNQKHENNIEGVLIEDNHFRGKMVLMNSIEVVEGSVDVSHEEIDGAYLNFIDFDIKKSVAEGAENEVIEASKSQSNGCEVRPNKLLEETKMDAISPCEEEKEEGKHGAFEGNLNYFITSNDELERNQSTSSKDYEAFEKHCAGKVATDEPSESFTTSNEEQLVFAQNVSFETYYHIMQRKTSESRVSEEENKEACKTIDEPSKALESQKDSSRDLEHGPQTSEEHEAKNLDAGVYLELEHDERISSAHSKTLETDDTLIRKQMPEESVEEEVTIWDQISIDEGNGLEKSSVERQNECVARKPNEEQENNSEEDRLLVEDNDSRGKIILMNSSGAVEGSIEQDGNRQCEEVVIIGEDFEPLQWKNHVPNEPTDAIRLDAIDIEIKKLAAEDDANGVSEESMTELGGYEDIDVDSFEIELKEFINPCEKENEGEDGALEESVFEIAIQTDCNPNMMFEKQSKDSDVEAGKVDIDHATSITDVSAKVNKSELELENNGILGEVKVLNREEIACVSNISKNKTELENNGIIEKITIKESGQLDEELDRQSKAEQNGQRSEPELTRSSSSRYLEEFDRFSTEVKAEADDNTLVSVKHLIHTSERSDIEVKESSQSHIYQNPSKGSGNATNGEGSTFKTSEVKESVTKGNLVSTNREVSSTFCILKKTIEELRQSHNKKSTASPAKGREKHKPRSSLFSDCMCCTTAMN